MQNCQQLLPLQLQFQVFHPSYIAIAIRIIMVNFALNSTTTITIASSFIPLLITVVIITLKYDFMIKILKKLCLGLNTDSSTNLC